MLAFTQRHHTIALIGLWLASQSGAALGIAVNWETTAAEIALAILYIALNVLIVGLIATIGLDGLQRRLHNLTIPTRWLIPLAGGLLILWAVPLKPEYPFDALRWLVTTLLVGAVVLAKQAHVSPFVRRVGFLTLLIVTLWFNLATVDIYPTIYTDEGWNLNKAWTALHVGPLYAPSINLGIFGDPERLTGQVVWWGVGQWLRVTGLSIWSGRLAMFFFAPLLIALASQAARSLFDSDQAGKLTALFISASVLTLYVSHFVRQEVILATVLALALYLHARAEKKPRFREPFFLGLLIALALDIHPVAFTYCFAFGAFYLGRTAWASFRARRIQWDVRLSGIIVGGLLGITIYLVVHVLPDANAFLNEASNRYSAVYGKSESGLKVITSRLLELVNHIRSWYALSLVEATLVVGAVVIVFLGKRARERSLLGLFGLMFVGWFIIGSRNAPTYPAFYLPLAGVLVGGVSARLLARPGRSFAAALVLVAVISGVGVRRTVQTQESGINSTFETCLTALKAQLPESSMILGEHLFWLARPELTGYASRTLVEAPWPGHDTAWWWAWIDPDIVLWPGPIYGPHARYVREHEYRPVEIAECPPTELNIWLKPGIELSGATPAS